MAIVSSFDLGKRYVELTDRYLNTGEPINVTKNGYGHSVLLGVEEYERMYKELIALKIDKGIREAREGKGIPLDESMERIRMELVL